eukprot:SAG11_NODE_1851_length_4167_cov_1.585054_6_plen_67_part_00
MIVLLQVAMTVFSILICAHMLACAWFWVGSNDETDASGHHIYGYQLSYIFLLQCNTIANNTLLIII